MTACTITTAASSAPGLVSERMRLVHAAGFVVHAARHIEIGEVEPRLRELLRAPPPPQPDQRIQPGEKILLAGSCAIRSPSNSGLHRGGGAFGRDVGRR